MCIFWRIWIFWLDCGYFASLMMCIWAISKKDRITISRSIISSWEGKMKFQNLISQSSGAFDHSKNQWFYQTTGQIHQIEKPDKNWRGPVVGCQIMIRYIWYRKLSNIFDFHSQFSTKNNILKYSLIHGPDGLFWISKYVFVLILFWKENQQSQKIWFSKLEQITCPPN